MEEQKKKQKIIQRKALSVSEVSRFNPKVMKFDGVWRDSMGCPELTGSWLIWGPSGNGKTRFALQLAKYLTQFGKVCFNSLEEGLSLSMKQAFNELGMQDVSRKLTLLDQEPIDELIIRLEQKRSPDIVFIDSIQYTGMNYNDYKKLRYRFKNKLFILISHADGKEPAGRVAKSIRYDAFIKISVYGYVATPVGRYGGGLPYIVWAEGAEKLN
jgi:DNA polymerase III delta prime subunit